VTWSGKKTRKKRKVGLTELITPVAPVKQVAVTPEVVGVQNN
jgi:hypothetical protein